MRRVVPCLAGAVCVLAFVWAISFGTLPPADFTFSNLSEIETIDPALATGQPEGRVVQALFEGLCAWDPEDLSAGKRADSADLSAAERARLNLADGEELWRASGVAEWYVVSADRKTYTFHLRADAKWSDGSPVVADDFAWSLRRFLHPGTGAEYTSLLGDVVGAKRFIAAQVAVGDAVQIELEERHHDAPRFASGMVLEGELLRIEPPVFTVRIDGRTRRFSADAGALPREGFSSKEAWIEALRSGTPKPRVERHRWILPHFDSVGIKASDRRRLEIRLSRPVPYFPNLMGFYPMFPVHRPSLETHGYPAWTKPENLVGNGPFVLEFRRIRDRIRLVKNPHYWDRRNVRSEVVDVLAVESYSTNLNLYMTGHVDWITAVPPEVIPDLLKREEGDFAPAPYLATYYYLFNTKKPPLDDARVRQALAMAIDKQEIVERITRAGQQPARSLVPASLAEYVGYTPPECAPRNVAKARALLAEAGYPGGRGFRKIEILYNTSEAHQSIAELIQSQWKESLQIDVGLRNQEWGAYLTSRRTGDFDVARAGWIGDYLDPNTFLELLVADNPNNHAGYANARYDELIETALLATDLPRRMRRFHQAEEILMDELPIVPLYFYVTQNMVRPHVKGFYPTLLDTHPVKHLWVDREEKARVLKTKGPR